MTSIIINNLQSSLKENPIMRFGMWRIIKEFLKKEPDWYDRKKRLKDNEHNKML